MYLKITTGILAIIIASGSTLAQAPSRTPTPTPAVLPDPVQDVPLGSDLEFFYDFSWRLFIALNWPAQGGAAGRGLPDRKRAFSDTDGPRVWMTWKSRYEIFQADGALPRPWASYDERNPCGQGFRNDVLTLSSFAKFSDFNQANFGFKLANPLVAQNHTYVRYDVHVNEPEFNSIVGNKWYLAKSLPNAQTVIPFNEGSTSVKAAWRVLKETDKQVRDRYYVVPNAQVFDGKKCTLQDVALVGLHIVTKTLDRPQWIWSSFEHVDNVPGLRGEPTPPPNVPYSFYDPKLPPTLLPATRPPSVSSRNVESDPAPMQVVRKHMIFPKTMDSNKDYWKQPEIQGKVWQNYMLVVTQWSETSLPGGPANDGDPFPKTGFNLSNSTLETYFQDADENGIPSCMTCHAVSNHYGRDFVMFVSMDAFRPKVRAPGDLFTTKTVDGPNIAAATLSGDPMLKSLMQFIEAAGQK
jgi:hypothetical protein